VPVPSLRCASVVDIVTSVIVIDQLQTAGLLLECVMLRDALACLSVCLTPSDVCGIINFLCTF